MWRVVGAEHVDDALVETSPDRVAMRAITNGRVHLGAHAKPLVAVRRREGQMVGCHLDRSHILMITQKLHLLAG